MPKKNFLFELGCEELPTSCMVTIAESIREKFTSACDKRQLQFEEITLFYTPRRIALWIENLDTQQAPQSIERLGPSVDVAFGHDGLPTLACLGFIKSCNASLDQLSRKQTKRGEYVALTLNQTGKKTSELLTEILEEATSKLPIPKAMRWGDNEFSFIRPVHWVVALFGNEIIPVTLFNKKADNKTRGHRFHAPHKFTLTSADYYETALEQAKVIVDPDKRIAAIKNQIKALNLAGKALIKDNLLNEVSQLVEWPVILVGTFNPAFLSVPQEALIMAMESHQKCFPVIDQDGKLQPLFIITSNIESNDAIGVIKGNEKVINARLSDAAFFWEQDRKKPLDAYYDSLKNVIYQKGLGTLEDKTKRIEKLSTELGKLVGTDSKKLKHVAHLAKCDLLTGMVYEFPKLQGVMGAYYAKEPALREQYLPRFSGDDLPKTSEGLSLALTDRLDTVVGAIGINKKPTGTKDPFGLRRAAIAIVRLFIEKEIDTALTPLLEKAFKNYPNLSNENTISESCQFIFERLKPWYTDRNISANIISAVQASGTDNLLDFDRRVHALNHFLISPEAQALCESNKRVSNMLKNHQATALDKTKLSLAEEKALVDAIEKSKKTVSPFLKQADYLAALNELASLKPFIDDFFDNVMIMDENFKENRLAILVSLKALFNQIADLSEV